MGRKVWLSQFPTYDTQVVMTLSRSSISHLEKVLPNDYLTTLAI